MRLLIATLLLANIMLVGPLMAEEIALPNEELLLADPTASIQLFRLPEGADKKSYVMPELFHLDIEKGKIRGLTVTYPQQVTYQALVDLVDQQHKQWKRFQSDNVVVWRNDKKGIAIQVSDGDPGKSGPQLILLPLKK